MKITKKCITTKVSFTYHISFLWGEKGSEQGNILNILGDVLNFFLYERQNLEGCLRVSVEGGVLTPKSPPWISPWF